jgi:hypothetical protein
MATPCFQKPDSNPPVCGVHNERLVPEQIRVDDMKIDCQRCPRTGSVVKDSKKQKGEK